MAHTPSVPENTTGAYTVDDLIKALRDLKKAHPRAGARPVFAGDTNFISVQRAAIDGHGAVVLTPTA